MLYVCVHIIIIIIIIHEFHRDASLETKLYQMLDHDVVFINSLDPTSGRTPHILMQSPGIQGEPKKWTIFSSLQFLHIYYQYVQLFIMSSYLNILCMSSAKPYYTKNSN